VFLSLLHRNKTSVSIEPMDDDFYNNNVTNSKPGNKRRATDDLQSGISQVYVKFMVSNYWWDDVTDELKFEFDVEGFRSLS